MDKDSTVELVEAPAAAASKGAGRQEMYFDDELGTVIATAELTARYFGVTRQTLSNWVKRGCPKHEYGYYDIKAVSAYQLQASGATAPPEDERDIDKMSLEQQKRYYDQRLKAAQAEAAELRTSIMRGDYLPRQQIVDDLGRFAVSLKRSLQGLGRKMSREAAGVLGPMEVRRFDRLMSDTMAEAMRQLSVEGVYHGEPD